MVCYVWMEEETNYFLKVIEEKNITTIFKQTKANIILVNLTGWNFTRITFRERRITIYVLHTIRNSTLSKFLEISLLFLPKTVTQLLKFILAELIPPLFVLWCGVGGVETDSRTTREDLRGLIGTTRGWWSFLRVCCVRSWPFWDSQTLWAQAAYKLWLKRGNNWTVMVLLYCDNALSAQSSQSRCSCHRFPLWNAKMEPAVKMALFTCCGSRVVIAKSIVFIVIVSIKAMMMMQTRG